MKKSILFHGSRQIVEKPEFGLGNPKNDYGLGFYCTKNIELAKEWACSEENNGFANKYELNIEGLSTQNLNGKGFSILNWMAVLLENRTFDISTPLALQAKEYILDHFLPDYKSHDIIIGYRADDSYFSFSKAFLNNSISLQQLDKAMHLGKLGEQYVIKSKEAFERIKFVEAIPAKRSVYYPKRKSRDSNARQSYTEMLAQVPVSEALYIMDIIRKKIGNNDLII
ncbi:MAG: DUF3990 domain-containing protein [Bacteroidales bacterium]|nr:DUF3990 domain-containing protein [Bacteroidales bacterium]